MAWGKIIEHRQSNFRTRPVEYARSAEGVRAEFAKPVFFYEPSDKDTARLLAAIAERLGAEIVKPPWFFTAGYDEDMNAGKYGVPISHYFPDPDALKKRFVMSVRMGMS